ncbi:Crinkler (CRN) [Phytophthora megakarya]|uniref:Crinkler (CRN) n=1 Tax=Phytophthora megakarya TaxID=4795 RepID=A0A225UTZ3_9STRA|nr:Crinkler (CRN) [Phytophthora megakarya]
MVKLFCAIVDVTGSSFPVNIVENETVGDLKKAIRDDNSATITCDARELQLFLAKSGSIEDALNTKGILSRVYCLAMLRLGCYDPARRTQDHDVGFWYEEKKLCIHIQFKTGAPISPLRDSLATLRENP